MNIFGRIAAFAAATLFLAACSTVPEVPYDRTASAVHKIGLVTPSFPTDARVVLASDVGQSFGLVGALVDASLQSKRESTFKTLMATQSFVAQDRFVGALEDALRKDGYEVVRIPAPRDKTDFLKEYPAPSEPVDAYLDVVVGDYGYVAAGIGKSTPYRPTLGLGCKLVRASDSAVLMEDLVKLNPVELPDPLGLRKAPKQVTLSADPAYEFPTFDDLSANGKKAADGLDGAFAEATQSVATLLK
jgi:hypothetical protein